MSLCYYDILEKMILDIEKWKKDPQMSKADVIDATRERVVILMRHVQTTPMIGSAYAFPGDIDLSAVLSPYDA